MSPPVPEAWPVPQRFANKTRLGTRVQDLDIRDWVAQAPDDPVCAITVTIWPADGGRMGREDLRVSRPRLVLSPAPMIVATFADGREGRDYVALFGVVSRAGRADFFPIGLYVSELIPASLPR